LTCAAGLGVARFPCLRTEGKGSAVFGALPQWLPAKYARYWWKALRKERRQDDERRFRVARLFGPPQHDPARVKTERFGATGGERTMVELGLDGNALSTSLSVDCCCQRPTYYAARIPPRRIPTRRSRRLPEPGIRRPPTRQHRGSGSPLSLPMAVQLTTRIAQLATHSRPFSVLRGDSRRRRVRC
jgi:hypothetical protein